MNAVANNAMIWNIIKNQSTLFHALDGVKSRRGNATETRQKVEDQRPVRMTPKRHWRIFWMEDSVDGGVCDVDAVFSET
jgi:hypothetical protein